MKNDKKWADESIKKIKAHFKEISDDDLNNNLKAINFGKYSKKSESLINKEKPEKNLSATLVKNISNEINFNTQLHLKMNGSRAISKAVISKMRERMSKHDIECVERTDEEYLVAHTIKELRVKQENEKGIIIDEYNRS